MLFRIVVIKIGSELKKIGSREIFFHFFPLVGKILTIYFTHFYTAICEEVKMTKNVLLQIIIFLSERVVVSL